MKRIFVYFIAFIFCQTTYVYAGNYKDSAHGDNTHGVERTSTSQYATGNCAHCHEQHASISGVEPTPDSGDAAGPGVNCVFAQNFNISKTTGPYIPDDNFCFYCHTNMSSVQSGGIVNNEFSCVFGSYSPALAGGILDAFNLSANKTNGSYHNLYDIWRFAKSRFNFFKDESNPCVACHNPHLAKRNKANTTDPAYSVLSLPSDHNNLWGDSADSSERMSRYTTYRPPYYNSTATYEPDGSAIHNGSKMPDYNTFCLDCHQHEVPSTRTTSMHPDTTPGYLTAIDWGASGDMHGGRPRINSVDGMAENQTGTILNPYHDSPDSNYVLSCMDCHEPHGSVLVSARPSSYLLRKKVNNNVVEGCGILVENFCETDFCGSCHTFDHCGADQSCFECHYHGGVGTGAGWCDIWTGPVF